MTSSSPRLAAADRLLLRSVFRYARVNGWKRQYEFETEPMKSERWWHWNGKTADERVFLELSTFKWSANEWRLGATISAAEGVEIGGEERLDLVRAVDVLCALGVLPSELSSQYRAGANDIFTALTADDPQIIADAVAIALASKAVS